MKKIIISLISLITFIYLINWLLSLKQLEISSLQMEGALLPAELKCDWYDINDINWNYGKQYQEEFIYMGYAASDGETFQWTDEKNGIVVNVVIVNYKSPIIAYLYYRLQDPYRLYKDSFSNAKNSNLYEFPLWKNTFSSEDTVQCAAGDTTYCNGWFYRARYSQYFLYIRYHGPDCIESFEHITKSINEQFIKFLR